MLHHGPSTTTRVVIISQIVEGCEERLQPEQIEELLAAIQTHLQ